MCVNLGFIISLVDHHPPPPPPPHSSSKPVTNINAIENSGAAFSVMPFVDSVHDPNVFDNAINQI